MKKFFSGFLGVSLATLGILVASPAKAAILFSETFDTDTANLADTLSTYSDFSYTGSGDAFVQNGQLRLTTSNARNRNFFFDALPAVTGDIIIEADISKTPGGSSFNTGLVVGDNNFVFHPGLFGGAFRIEGSGGFSNQNMGFTPSAFPVMHHMKIEITGNLFDITITDGLNPANVYTTTFNDPIYTPGDRIGLTVEGRTLTNEAVFDNLVVRTIDDVPEPNTLLSLLTVGAIATRSIFKKRAAKN